MQDQIARAMISILDLYGEVTGLVFKHVTTGEEVEIWLADASGQLDSSGPPLPQLLADNQYHLAGGINIGGTEENARVRELFFQLNPIPAFASLDPEKRYTPQELATLTGLGVEAVIAGLGLWMILPAGSEDGQQWQGSDLQKPLPLEWLTCLGFADH